MANHNSCHHPDFPISCSLLAPRANPGIIMAKPNNKHKKQCPIIFEKLHITQKGIIIKTAGTDEHHLRSRIFPPWFIALNRMWLIVEERYAQKISISIAHICIPSSDQKACSGVFGAPSEPARLLRALCYVVIGAPCDCLLYTSEPADE